MKECDNSTRKIHISNNFILSISLLIMFDTLLLRPSLHCKTPLHFTTLHQTTLHYTSLHFTLHHTSANYTSLHLSTLHLQTLHFISFTLHYPFIQLYALTFPIVLFHFTSHSIWYTWIVAVNCYGEKTAMHQVMRSREVTGKIYGQTRLSCQTLCQIL